MKYLKLVETEDGTFTARSETYDECYHSTRDGALRESLKKHVEPAFSLVDPSKERLKVLDICFGLGYNTLTTLAHKRPGRATGALAAVPEAVPRARVVLELHGPGRPPNVAVPSRCSALCAPHRAGQVRIHGARGPHSSPRRLSEWHITIRLRSQNHHGI